MPGYLLFKGVFHTRPTPTGVGLSWSPTLSSSFLLVNQCTFWKWLWGSFPPKDRSRCGKCRHFSKVWWIQILCNFEQWWKLHFKMASIILIGVGYASAFGTACVCSYYCSLMAITIFYFFQSFQSTLPWSRCNPEWESSHNLTCGPNNTVIGSNRSLPELYFK